MKLKRKTEEQAGPYTDCTFTDTIVEGNWEWLKNGWRITEKNKIKVTEPGVLKFLGATFREKNQN